MTKVTRNPALCPVHGHPSNRQTCAACNAAYQRGYLRRRAERHPEWAIWHRAKKRAARQGLDFNLPLESVVIPQVCPVLGILLFKRVGRSLNSPSLDRIDPKKGYVVGNCRVVSDHANRIKSNLDLVALKARAEFGSPALRGSYAKVVEYVDREELLAEIRRKASAGGRVGHEWEKIGSWLDRRFATGPST
jgi:hypothetical protein